MLSSINPKKSLHSLPVSPRNLHTRTPPVTGHSHFFFLFFHHIYSHIRIFLPTSLFTMKIFESSHLFNYTWEQVSAANWVKYPNELSTHVVSVDILNREVDPERHVLKTERLIACKQAVPRWLRAIIGGEEYSFVREVSEVDLVNRKLIMKLANMTLLNLLLVNETVVYTPDERMPAGRTLFQQEAEITAFSPFSGICNKIEDWSVERFGQNAQVGKRGFEGVLELVAQRWEESGILVKGIGHSLMKEIDEVNDMTHEVIHDVGEKTSSVLSEVTKLSSYFSRS